ncbi:MAG TPA: c-type cytochrome [Puia sp.]|nr:c-type cytochrome [Puia sp.]
MMFMIAAGIVLFSCQSRDRGAVSQGNSDSAFYARFIWKAPDSSLIPQTEAGNLIRYGRKLITETSLYFGPGGRISQAENGMNCQNCHLQAGTHPYANPFFAVASCYPLFRARSGHLESVESRVNDCLERSLNGKRIDSTSIEMKAMVAYIEWIGSEVPRGIRPRGSGTVALRLLNRAADTIRGMVLYQIRCQACHGPEGQGQPRPDRSGYIYPPLWGNHAYNVSAGMYRLSSLAGFIKYAMPFGVKYPMAVLTDEQAWDLAAFINSKPHPLRLFKQDWPLLASKPFDYPFGPYADSFAETQHRYGPFIPIEKNKNAEAQKNNELSAHATRLSVDTPTSR